MECGGGDCKFDIALQICTPIIIIGIILDFDINTSKDTRCHKFLIDCITIDYH